MSPVKDTAVTNGMSSHDVETILNYHLDSGNGGEQVFYPGTAGNYRRQFDARAIQVKDIRGHEEDFCLDQQGFQILRHESKEKEFADEDEVKDVIYEEVIEMLKEATGATLVKPFSHLIRSQRWDTGLDASKGLADKERVKTRVPARFVHVDHSYMGSQEVVRDNLDEAEAAQLCKTRWAIINVWRPIRHEVTRDPLAVCDASSIPESDLCGVKAVLPQDSDAKRVSKGDNFETWHLKSNPAHRWYYLSGMKPDEALLIKIFDSKKDGRARRTPHTSFTSDKDHGPPRESIEIRSFVFWEDQSVE